MPAQKRKVRNYRPKKTNPAKIYLIYIFGVLVLIAIPFLYKNIFSRKYFNGVDKMSLAVQEKSGDVSILVFDPVRQEITKVRIPGDTQVEVAGGLGVWKIKSIWELGIDRKLDGHLLTKTLTNYMKFPVFVWAGSDAIYYFENNLSKMLSLIIKPQKTNLNLADKIALSFFSLNVKNTGRREIDLSETSFLKKKVLTDGNEGFVLSGQDSPILYSYFSDYNFSDKALRVLIKDATGKAGLADNAGEIVEVMGGKIASIIRVNEEESVCNVSGPNSKLSDLTARVLGCTISKESYEGNYDMEILLGKLFIN